MLQDILTGLVIVIALLFGVYFLSKIQMKAWLHEIDKYFYDKFEQLKKAKENGKKE